MLDNWIFASSESKRSEYENFGNGTYQAQPAIRPNAADEWFERLRIRDVLLKRQFRCPEGTLSCVSVGAPDVCCGGSSTCVKVQNSNIGDIGCCPNGQSCAGSISCNESAGYTSCPGSSNGGCCLPGFQCSGIGCKLLVNAMRHGRSLTVEQVSRQEPPLHTSSRQRPHVHRPHRPQLRSYPQLMYPPPHPLLPPHPPPHHHHPHQAFRLPTPAQQAGSLAPSALAAAAAKTAENVHQAHPASATSPAALEPQMLRYDPPAKAQQPQRPRANSAQQASTSAARTTHPGAAE